MMSRILLGIFTIFSVVLLALGAPLPETRDLEKRITHTGTGTWFHPGLGNCGLWNDDNDHIVAIPKTIYDENDGSNCNQYVRVTNKKTGKTEYALTRDSCPTCPGGNLDMSPSLFKLFAPLSDGVFEVEWNFMARGWKP